MNVCGCGGGVPTTHLNWAFALDGGAIVSGGMPIGVKEAGSTEGVAGDKGLGPPSRLEHPQRGGSQRSHSKDRVPPDGHPY